MNDTVTARVDIPAASGSGAVVIPFPVPATRLQRALVALAKAQEEQRLAVAAWRTSLAQLQESMTGLAGSLEGYRAVLTTTQDDVKGLGDEARRLESWADKVIATQPSSS